MVDREVLKAHGLDPEGLQKLFVGVREKRSDKVNALIDRMVNRCRGGRDLNIEHSNVFAALDRAWDSAFDQISPSLVRTCMDLPPNSPEVLDILKTSGLDPSKVLTEIPDPKTPGKSIKRLDVAMFNEITVPLCMAYVKIRMAKLVNDRKQVPFLKYDPAVSDDINRVRCALVTEAIEEQSNQFAYFDVYKQAVFMELHYADALQFPVEEWYTECQWLEEDSPYEKEEGSETKTVGGIKVKKVITKEGIRYHFPHPSRTYRDLSYPAYTLNTSTGCSYAGFWQVVPWQDVMDREGYFNLDTIGFDNFYAWYEGKRNLSYWINVYRGCATNFPSDLGGEKGSGRLDSEKAVDRWYSRDWADKPIVLHHHYERLVPKDVGLGDYDCPVWIRFVLAADDTVVYAAPVCYDPAVLWWGYDVVHGRTHNASMTLECLPFQDQFSNLLAQHLLSVKQNLANLSLVDTEVLPEATIKEIEGLGEKLWRKITILRADFSKMFKAKMGMPGPAADPVRGCIVSHKFPQQNTNETLNTMKVILDTLERVLVMSSQEVGQSASHEQTREEVRQISFNTSTRVAFTNTGIDFSIDSWKKQLYEAKMAYGAMSYYAQVPMEKPLSDSGLEKLGFTAAGPYDEKNGKQPIKANKTAVKYNSFVSNRDGQNRVNEMESAKVMLEMFDRAMSNPIVGPAIGPDQAISLMNQIGRFLGFPRDFKLENTGQTASQMQQIQQGMQQMMQQVQQALQAAQQDAQGALKNIMTVNEEQDQQLKALEMQVAQLTGQSMQGQPDVMPRLPIPMPPGPQMPTPNGRMPSPGGSDFNPDLINGSGLVQA